MSLPKSQRNQSTRTGQRDQGQGHHGEGGGRVDLPVQSENLTGIISAGYLNF